LKTALCLLIMFAWKWRPWCCHINMTRQTLFLLKSWKLAEKLRIILKFFVWGEESLFIMGLTFLGRSISFKLWTSTQILNNVKFKWNWESRQQKWRKKLLQSLKSKNLKKLLKNSRNVFNSTQWMHATTRLCFWIFLSARSN